MGLSLSLSLHIEVSFSHFELLRLLVRAHVHYTGWPRKWPKTWMTIAEPWRENQEFLNFLISRRRPPGGPDGLLSRKGQYNRKFDNFPWSPHMVSVREFKQISSATNVQPGQFPKNFPENFWALSRPAEEREGKKTKNEKRKTPQVNAAPSWQCLCHYHYAVCMYVCMYGASCWKRLVKYTNEPISNSKIPVAFSSSLPSFELFTALPLSVNWRHWLWFQRHRH